MGEGGDSKDCPAICPRRRQLLPEECFFFFNWRVPLMASFAFENELINPPPLQVGLIEIQSENVFRAIIRRLDSTRPISTFHKKWERGRFVVSFYRSF